METSNDPEALENIGMNRNASERCRPLRATAPIVFQHLWWEIVHQICEAEPSTRIGGPRVAAENLARAFPSWIPIVEVRWMISSKNFEAKVAHFIDKNRLINFAGDGVVDGGLGDGDVGSDDDSDQGTDNMALDFETRGALRMFASEPFSEFFARARTFPVYPLHNDVERAARRIADFVMAKSRDPTGFQQRRRAELQARLTEYECKLEGGFCDKYISGGTLASLGEVVAVMIITARLFKRGAPPWCQVHQEYERELIESIMIGEKKYLDKADGGGLDDSDLDDVWIEEALRIVDSQDFYFSAEAAKKEWPEWDYTLMEIAWTKPSLPW